MFCPRYGVKWIMCICCEDWSSCQLSENAVCGRGIKTRLLNCVRSDGKLVELSMCKEVTVLFSLGFFLNKSSNRNPVILLFSSLFFSWVLHVENSLLPVKWAALLIAWLQSGPPGQNVHTPVEAKVWYPIDIIIRRIRINYLLLFVFFVLFFLKLDNKIIIRWWWW